MALRIVILAVVCHMAFSHQIIDEYAACRRSNAKDLNGCFGDLVQAVAPYLKKGIPELDVPKMDPLYIDDLDLSMTVGGGAVDGTLKITNSFLHGLSEWQVRKVFIEPADGRVSIDVRTPELKLNGHYKLDGKIMGLGVIGDSTYKFDYKNIDDTYILNIKYDESTGYAKIYNSILRYEVESGSLQLDNLLGSELLSDAGNRVLNSNFLAITRVTAPTLADRFVVYFDKLLSGLLKHIPADLAHELTQQRVAAH